MNETQQLKRLIRNRTASVHNYPEDVSAMKAALNRAGYDASDADIEWAWEQHSDNWAAGWLVIESCGNADGTVKYLLEYLVPES